MDYSLKDEIAILLIEDDSADVELLEAYLSEAPNFQCRLTAMKTLKEAEMAAWQDKFSLVIMDLGLVGTRGIDTFRAFKKLQVDLPVIIVTGLADEETGLQAINEGAQDYLVKGQFDGKTVVQAIRYALARYQIENELQSSEERFRSLINDNTDGMMVLGKADEIRFLNPAARKLLDLCPLDYGKCFEHKVFPNKITEIVTQKKNGDSCYLEAKASLLVWENEESVLVTLRDVTNMRKMEESLRSSNTELRRLKRELEKDLADSVSRMLQNDSDTVNKAMQKNSSQFIQISATELRNDINSLDIIIKNLQDALEYNELNVENCREKLQTVSSIISKITDTLNQF
ncbi:MAG: response regulator [Candidatus Cloacimonetes bacterium]|nr:response regulator [Candidatus Cloacimonadota bacterium]